MRTSSGRPSNAEQLDSLLPRSWLSDLFPLPTWCIEVLVYCFLRHVVLEPELERLKLSLVDFPPLGIENVARKEATLRPVRLGGRPLETE